MAPKRTASIAAPQKKSEMCGKNLKNTAKRAKRESDPVVDNLRVLQNVFLNDDYQLSPEVPRRVREMMAEGLAEMFCDFQENRHAFQVRMIDIVRKHLDDVEQSLEKSLKEKKTVSDSANEEREKLIGVKAESKAMHEEKMNARREKDTETDAEEASLVTAEKELEVAANNIVSLGKSNEIALKDEVAMKKIYEESFKLLKDTPPQSSSEIKKLVESLKPQLRKLSMDESLVRVAPMALAKPLEIRGKFDNIAIDNVGSAFVKTLEEITDSIARHATTMEAAEASKHTAQSVVDAAKAKVEAAREALTAAKEEERDALLKLKAAEKEVREHDKRTKLNQNELLAAEAELENFEAAKTAFRFLHCRSAPKKMQANQEPAKTEEALLDCPVAAEVAEVEAEMVTA